jgi:hypothetical protein
MKEPSCLITMQERITLFTAMTEKMGKLGLNKLNWKLWRDIVEEMKNKMNRLVI